MSLTFLAGRAIVSADRDESRHVMMITRAMAERFWPGAPENAVGREVRMRTDGPTYQIVGVVANHTVDTPGEQAKSYVLLPLERDLNYGNYIIRTATPAAGMIPTFEPRSAPSRR